MPPTDATPARRFVFLPDPTADNGPVYQLKTALETGRRVECGPGHVYTMQKEVADPPEYVYRREGEYVREFETAWDAAWYVFRNFYGTAVEVL